MKDKQGWIVSEKGTVIGLRVISDALREDQSTGDIVKSGATEWI